MKTVFIKRLVAQGLACALLVFTAYGADEAVIHQAIAEAAGKGGGIARIPAGVYELTRSITIPEGVELTGESETAVVLTVPQDAPFPAIVLDHARHAGVSRLQLVEKDHRYKGKSPALLIQGNSRFVAVREVSTTGFSAGFLVGRSETGTSRGLVFEACRAEAAAYFGFDLNHVETVTLEHCYSFRHRLDGIKFRKKVRDVTVLGGDSSYNGAYSRDLNGNAIDGYAGANAASVYSMVAEGNNGSGFYFKTGPLSLKDFGYVRNLYFVDVRARENRTSGIDLNRSGGDTIKRGQTELPPLLNHAVVIGGIGERNGASGYYVRGRSVALITPFASGNGAHGMDLASAWDTTVIVPTVRHSAAAGIRIGVDPVKGIARRVSILGGHVDDSPESCLVGPESRHILIEQLTGGSFSVAPEATSTTRMIPSDPLP